MGYQVMTEDIWKREFASRLVMKMVEGGFDQSDLAKASGVSQQSISNYIHRKSIPNGHIIDKLARALRCQISDLIDF